MNGTTFDEMRQSLENLQAHYQKVRDKEKEATSRADRLTAERDALRAQLAEIRILCELIQRALGTSGVEPAVQVSLDILAILDRDVLPLKHSESSDARP